MQFVFWTKIISTLFYKQDTTADSIKLFLLVLLYHLPSASTIFLSRKIWLFTSWVSRNFRIHRRTGCWNCQLASLFSARFSLTNSNRKQFWNSDKRAPLQRDWRDTEGNSPLILLHVLPFSDSLIRSHPAGRRQKKEKTSIPLYRHWQTVVTSRIKEEWWKKEFRTNRKRAIALYKKSRLFLRKVNFSAKLLVSFLVSDFATKIRIYCGYFDTRCRLTEILRKNSFRITSCERILCDRLDNRVEKEINII